MIVQNGVIRAITAERIAASEMRVYQRSTFSCDPFLRRRFHGGFLPPASLALSPAETKSHSFCVTSSGICLPDCNTVVRLGKWLPETVLASKRKYRIIVINHSHLGPVLRIQVRKNRMKVREKAIIRLMTATMMMMMIMAAGPLPLLRSPFNGVDQGHRWEEELLLSYSFINYRHSSARSIPSLSGIHL